MLARARQVAPAGLPVEFVLADATVYPFDPASFDLLVSRFGVMFFAEPALSFANMRRALRPSGRLAFACWREPRENPWMMAPLQAVYKHVPKLPQHGPEDPGPFAFASEAARAPHSGRGRIFRISPWSRAISSLDVAIGRGLDAAVRGRARNRTGQPRARRATARRARRRDEFDPRGARAIRQRTGGAACRIDLDRDGAGFLRSGVARRSTPAPPRSSPDARWSARPFPCPARSPIPAANETRARRRRCWGRAAP